MGVRGVNTPPVVDKHVEGAEHDDQERCRPFCLEAHCNHDTRRETNNGHEDTRNAPSTTEDEADEEENEQDASRKEEASKFTCQENRSISRFGRDLLFLAVVLRKGGETS